MLNVDGLFEAVGGVPNDEGDGVFERFRKRDEIDIPIELTDIDKWSNFVNDDLYEMDSKLREFLRKIRYRKQKKGGYRTTASMVFTWMYGRTPEPSDSSVCRMLHELLMYYCTSYTGPTTFQGKKVQRVYEFSKYAAAAGKRPYSLRLRLEESDGSKDPFRESGHGDHDKRRYGRRKHSVDGPTEDQGSGGDIGGAGE